MAYKPYGRTVKDAYNKCLNKKNQINLGLIYSLVCNDHDSRTILHSLVILQIIIHQYKYLLKR